MDDTPINRRQRALARKAALWSERSSWITHWREISEYQQPRSGRLSFFNLRSQLWWQFRELLDPNADNGIALPPDPELAKELCAPRWELSGMTIKVESRDQIIERVGRSPDRATAVILAQIDYPKVRAIRAMAEPDNPCLEWNPYA